MSCDRIETGEFRLSYKFFEVRELPRKPNRKTHDYDIVNRTSGTSIGTISWYGPWRQFCFSPEGDTVWSSGCLADVEDAIRKIKSEGGR